MRVAIVAESFLPNVNGVTNSVCRVAQYLRSQGHEALIIAPAARPGQQSVEQYCGFPVESVSTVMVPMVNSLPIGVPTARVVRLLRQFQPDVVHAASPFVLGAAGILAARALKIPVVGVFQTDVAGFAENYKLAAFSQAAWRWTRWIHNRCDRTLAPSSATIEQLQARGIHRIHRWGRGVDLQQFSPHKRDKALRAKWTATKPGSSIIVGYVGRLAAEKSVHRLAVLDELDDVQVVVIGDGPERASLQQLMPNAIFAGQLTGEALAEAFASLDVFVHTGDFETFCQTVQEAHASGIPAIAPNVGGPRDLITDGVNGHLLAPAEFEQLLPEAVVSALKMRKRCRSSVQSRSWDAICAELMEHYRAVVAGNSIAIAV